MVFLFNTKSIIIMNSKKLNKLNLLFVITTLILILLSCNSKKQVDYFYINLDLVIQQTDSIRVFYKTDASINFNETEAFWTKISGNKKNQKVTLKFPNNIFPKQFRIDIGNSVKQPGIVINKLECQFKTNSFNLKGKEIYQTLRVDENNTILDKETGVLSRKDKTKKNGISLYPNGSKLNSRLENLFKKNKI